MTTVASASESAPTTQADGFEGFDEDAELARLAERTERVEQGLAEVERVVKTALDERDGSTAVNADAFRVDWETDELVPLPGEAGSAVIFDLGRGRYVQCYVESGELLIYPHKAAKLLLTPYNSDGVGVDVDGLYEQPGPDDRCKRCGGTPDVVVAWKDGYRNPVHDHCPVARDRVIVEPGPVEVDETGKGSFAVSSVSVSATS